MAQGLTWKSLAVGPTYFVDQGGVVFSEFQTATNESNSTYAGQTWTITPDQLIVVTKVIWDGAVTTNDYTLTIAGTNVGTISVTGKALGTWVISGGVELSASTAHTFDIKPPSGNVKFDYKAGTTGSDTGTLAWGGWQQASGNLVPAEIFFTQTTRATFGVRT